MIGNAQPSAPALLFDKFKTGSLHAGNPASYYTRYIGELCRSDLGDSSCEPLLGSRFVKSIKLARRVPFAASWSMCSDEITPKPEATRQFTLAPALDVLGLTVAHAGSSPYLPTLSACYSGHWTLNTGMSQMLDPASNYCVFMSCTGLGR